ncbi:hypothetical protein ACIBCR_15390 [Micromonospora echinospora]|uniref:hypothetical protein n=1 Tax=Micromonospora echinospora TaxID=1877 RepID=UPI0037B82AEB
MPTTDDRKPVDPREAAFAINVGDPLVVDVDQHGAGWTIIAVKSDTCRVYRDSQELTVPHATAYPAR